MESKLIHFNVKPCFDRRLVHSVHLAQPLQLSVRLATTAPRVWGPPFLVQSVHIAPHLVFRQQLLVQKEVTRIRQVLRLVLHAPVAVSALVPVPGMFSIFFFKCDERVRAIICFTRVRIVL